MLQMMRKCSCLNPFEVTSWFSKCWFSGGRVYLHALTKMGMV